MYLYINVLQVHLSFFLFDENHDTQIYLQERHRLDNLSNIS